MLFGVGSSWLAACATESTDGQTLKNYDPQEGGGDSGSANTGGTPSAGTSSTAGTAPSTSGTATGGSSGGVSSAGSGGTGGGSAGSGGSASGGSAGKGGSSSGGGGGSGGVNGNDACPDDADKTAPGKCGCGVPDTDSANAASCVALQNSLVHRYSFENDTKDSVGTAHGVLKGGATISGGALTLAGAKSGQYLDLPNALISGLSNLTIEAYVTWTASAGGDWQRIFDFGSSDMPEDTAGVGAKYLFLSTRKLRACYTSATPKNEIFVDSSTPLPTDTAAQVAVTVSNADNTMTLYLDGNIVGGTPLNLPLSAISDVNNWLGRSQYATDEYFGGKISEFRIYDAALSGPQLKASKKMGENTTYLKK